MTTLVPAHDSAIHESHVSCHCPYDGGITPDRLSDGFLDFHPTPGTTNEALSLPRYVLVHSPDNLTIYIRPDDRQWWRVGLEFNITHACQ